MTTELDKAIDTLRQERDDYRAQVDLFEHRITILNAEIHGMERARELFGSQDTPERVPQRRAVQKPVLALFGPGQGTWTMEGIVMATGLPGVAVQKFLSHAIKNGLLRRLPTSAPGPNAEYGLPVRAPAEAAE